MREIKFRLWDKTNRTMQVIQPVWFEENYWMDEDFAKCAAHENCELMQLTGLKDKNGKEIYEGDLVNEPEELGSTLNPWKVVWEDRAFFGLEGWDYEVPLEWETYEVVGNIYENPELSNETSMDNGKGGRIVY